MKYIDITKFFIKKTFDFPGRTRYNVANTLKATTKTVRQNQDYRESAVGAS